MRGSNKNLYLFLGVSAAASTEEIQTAYRRLSMQYHPDRNPEADGYTELFVKLSTAYDILSDTEKRKQYDLEGEAFFGLDENDFSSTDIVEYRRERHDSYSNASNENVRHSRNRQSFGVLLLLLVAVSFLILSRVSLPEPTSSRFNKNAATFQDSFRQALETAKPGDVITVPEGTFAFDRSLILNTDGVTIRGQGMEKSILSFKDQIAGAEGLSVSASNFTIEDLAIEDTVGDALKVNEGNNIVIRRIRTEWTNGPDVNNGAYGIYPVQTTNVLIEGNVAIAASDAGVYVGQSKQVIVRNNRAEFNVAGIEVENTIGADVYQNTANNNTGGILVFNMPSIPQRGYATRVYDNEVNNNNTANFAAPGTAVSGVPAGSGIMVNSNDQVEIFNNRVAGNNTANILISSYFSANYAGQRTLAEEFDPYPEEILIYDNTFSGGGTAPGFDYLVQLRDAIYGPTGAFPDIIWDGIIDPNKPEEKEVICVVNGDAKLLNIDAGNEFKGAGVDMKNHNCTVAKLAPIELAGT